MSALSIQPTYPIFTETDGQPLENGYIWIGTANLDPQGNPINVYWDAALTQLAGQPIRTQGGYPVNSGTPARLYVNSDYSIRVMNKNGSVVYSAPAATERYSGVVVQVDASQVTFDQSASYSQGTVGLALQAFVNIKNEPFNAAGDGVTDDSAAFAAAIAFVSSTGQKIYAPAGVYKLSQAFSTTGDLHIEGDGDSTVLDWSGTVTGSSYGIDVSGSLTQIQEISNASQGSLTVTFASTPSLSVDDVFVIFNPTAYSWSGFRPDYKAGEWCQVDGISGNDVSVTNPLYDGYLPVDVDVYKLTSPTVSLRNFRVKGTTVLGLIKVSLCNRPLIENVSGYLENNSIVYYDRCYMPTSINLNLFNKGDGGDDYGLAIGNSQHARTIGGNFYARRHAITHGGGGSIGCVTTRDSRVIGATLKNDINSATQAADYHGNTEDCVFDGCTIYNGILLGGKNNRYTDCNITTSLNGIVSYAGEIKGGLQEIANCKIWAGGDPSAIGRGIIDFGGNSSAITSNTDEALIVRVRNCHVIADGSTASTYFCIVRNESSTVKVNVEIFDITFDQASAMVGVLRTRADTGLGAVADSDFIIVDRVSGMPTGTYLCVANEYVNEPMRMMQQSGFLDVEATNGTAYTIPASAIDYKYPYPKIPTAHATTGGNTALGLNGNRPVIGGLYRLRLDNIWPWIQSGDNTNWSATATVRLNWSAGISDI
jgi:hypothetical protein